MVHFCSFIVLDGSGQAQRHGIWINERFVATPGCGGATLFQVPPGFSRGDKPYESCGVAERHSLKAGTRKSVALPHRLLVDSRTPRLKPNVGKIKDKILSNRK